MIDLVLFYFSFLFFFFILFGVSFSFYLDIGKEDKT